MKAIKIILIILILPFMCGTLSFFHSWTFSGFIDGCLFGLMIDFIFGCGIAMVELLRSL